MDPGITVTVLGAEAGVSTDIMRIGKKIRKGEPLTAEEEERKRSYNAQLKTPAPSRGPTPVLLGLFQSVEKVEISLQSDRDFEWQFEIDGLTRGNWTWDAELSAVCLTNVRIPWRDDKNNMEITVLGTIVFEVDLEKDVGAFQRVVSLRLLAKRHKPNDAAFDLVYVPRVFNGTWFGNTFTASFTRTWFGTHMVGSEDFFG